MTKISYFGKPNLTHGSVVPLTMFINYDLSYGYIYFIDKELHMLSLETKSKILQESDPSAVLDQTQRGAGGKKIFFRFFPVWELSFSLNH